jgi:hypothetical protein
MFYTSIKTGTSYNEYKISLNQEVIAMHKIIKRKAKMIDCPKCNLISYTIDPEVYGQCPYCHYLIHWRSLEKMTYNVIEREAV